MSYPKLGVLASFGMLSLLSGCGGGTKTVVQTVSSPPAASTPTTTTPTTTTPTTTTPTTTTSAGPPDCGAVDLHSFVGKCTHGGTTLILANRGSAVRLKTMTVKVVNVDTPQSISSGSGFTANAHGTFVSVTIAITNTTTSPQTFDEGSSTSQGQLTIGKNTYTVSFDAENTNDPKSFVTNNNDIQPGETRTGTIDFDVPSSAAQQVYKHGALLITNFGESPDSAQTAAVLKFFQS